MPSVAPRITLPEIVVVSVQRYMARIQPRSRTLSETTASRVPLIRMSPSSTTLEWIRTGLETTAYTYPPGPTTWLAEMVRFDTPRARMASPRNHDDVMLTLIEPSATTPWEPGALAFTWAKPTPSEFRTKKPPTPSEAVTYSVSAPLTLSKYVAAWLGAVESDWIAPMFRTTKLARVPRTSTAFAVTVSISHPSMTYGSPGVPVPDTTPFAGVKFASPMIRIGG